MSFAHSKQLTEELISISIPNLPLYASRVVDIYILRISTITKTLQSGRKLQLLGYKLFKGFISSR